MLAGPKMLVPRPEMIRADGANDGEKPARWCQHEGGWDPEVVEGNRDAEGFEVIPNRSIVERYIATSPGSVAIADSPTITCERCRPARS
jgi:hypothetical protein